LGGRLYVSGDSNLNGNLTIKGALNVQQLQNQNIINTTTSNYQLIVSEDISLNGRLYTSGDVSMQSRLFVNQDASFNSRILVASDVSIGGRLFVNGTQFTGTGGSAFTTDISTQSRLFVNQDASFNSRILIGSDLSIGGRLFVNTLNIFNNLNVGPITQFNSNGITQGVSTVSSNGGTFNGGVVSNDISLNANLIVQGKSNLQGQITAISGMISVADSSFNSRILVASDVSIGGRLFVNGSQFTGAGGSVFTTDISTQSRLFVNQDASFNSKVLVGLDVSLGGRLFANGDSNFNGNLNIGNFTKVSRITESIFSTTTTSNIDLTQGAVFYLGSAPAANFTANLINVPSDTNRTFVVTFIIDSSGTNKTYCNAITTSNTSTIGTSQTLYYVGGAANINVISANFITQTIVIINTTISPWKIVTNVNSMQ
jgi:hypothetical protein